MRIKIAGTTKLVKIDDIDYIKVSKFKWHAVKRENGEVKDIMALDKGKKKLVSLRRLIMDHCLQYNPTKYVVHANMDPMDCSYDNLLVVEPWEANSRRGLTKANKSGYKGVHKSGSKFVAVVQVDGRIHRLGTYKTAKEAAMAYDKRAKMVYSEAVTNEALGLL